MFTISLVLVAAYLGFTYYLAIRGSKKVADFRIFAVSRGDIHPVFVGITLAASISSTATFVINPGFVYADGMSAFVHYSVAALAGIACALTLLSTRLLAQAKSFGSVTVPQWIYDRYGSRVLSICFALFNLSTISFIVLILVGCALIVSKMFGLDHHVALVTILLTVFSYILIGGSYAHAFTNVMQGILMAFIAAGLFLSGWEYWEAGFFQQASEVGANYAALVNADSKLYNSWFSVFGSGFIITFALMLQPHIVTKVFYLRESSQIRPFLFSAIGFVAIFNLILFAGFYARFSGLEVVRQDAVIVEYVASIFQTGWFGDFLTSVVFVALLAAGMSTLDGILVALSASVVNDLYLPLRKEIDGNALAVTRWALVIVGFIALALAWNPPKLVGLFAQAGVYGLASASFVPLVFGIRYAGKIPVWIVGGAAVIGIGAHYVLHLGFGITNPAVSASFAIIASTAAAAVSLFLVRRTGGATLPNEISATSST